MIPDVVRVAANPDACSVRETIRALAKEDAPRRSIRGDEHWIKVVAAMKKHQQNLNEACTLEEIDEPNASAHMLRPEGLHLQMNKSSSERPESETPTAIGSVNIMRPEGVHLQTMNYSESDALSVSPSGSTVPKIRPEGLHFVATPIAESVSEIGEHEVQAAKSCHGTEVPSFIEIPGPSLMKKTSSRLGPAKIPRSPRRRSSLCVPKQGFKHHAMSCDTTSTTSSTMCEMESVSETSHSTNTLRPEGVHFLSTRRRHSIATNP